MLLTSSNKLFFLCVIMQLIVLDGKPYSISCDVSVPIPYPDLSLVDVSSTVVRQVSDT